MLYNILFIFIYFVTLCNVLKYYIWFMKNFSNIFYESQIIFERIFSGHFVCVCVYTVLLNEEHILIRKKILSNQPSSKFLLASLLLQNRKINCWTFLIVTKLQGLVGFFCHQMQQCFFSLLSVVVCCCVYLNRTRYQW